MYVMTARINAGYAGSIAFPRLFNAFSAGSLCFVGLSTFKNFLDKATHSR
jgi:hypothetical protein